MAFSASTLGYIGGPSTGPRLWSYRTADAKATVDSSGYFNDASNVLNIGDCIHMITSHGGSVEFGLMVVNANASGVVDCADLVALGGTDTD